MHYHENQLSNDILMHLWHPTNVTSSLHDIILHTFIPISYTLTLPYKSTNITPHNFITITREVTKQPHKFVSPPLSSIMLFDLTHSSSSDSLSYILLSYVQDLTCNQDHNTRCPDSLLADLFWIVLFIYYYLSFTNIVQITNYKYWEKHVQTLFMYLAQVVGTSQSHKTVLHAVQSPLFTVS